MAQVNEAMMSSLQKVDMLALCSSHDDRRGSGLEVPATPHFRHRDTSKAALPDPEAARSRFRPGNAGRRYLHPRRLQQCLKQEVRGQGQQPAFAGRARCVPVALPLHG